MNILQINSSARREGSQSTRLADRWSSACATPIPRRR